MARSKKTKVLEDLLRAKREEILRIAEKHGARNVRLFGSVAHGEATATSDIDLLVDTAEQTSPWFSRRTYRGTSCTSWSAGGCGDSERPPLAPPSPNLEGSQAPVKKDPRVYLAHILECAQKIQRYTRGGQKKFLKDTMTQDAVIRNFEIMGEAAKRVLET
jgi:hypothetical protein